MEESGSMMRRGTDAARTTLSNAYTQYALVPRHDNYACTLCLMTCLLMWMIAAVGLATAYGVVYANADSCGVACTADRSLRYHSCAWLGQLACYNGVDDGACASCAAPVNVSLMEEASFRVCCPFHPNSTLA